MTAQDISEPEDIYRDVDMDEAEISEPSNVSEKRKLTDEELDELYDRGSLRIVSQKNDFLLPQVKQLIDSNELLNLRPEYQRRLRWTTKQKSLLIESILMNVPIPPVFLYETDLARYEVMDGQQRLNTIREFLSNEFRLIGLTAWSALNGRTFSSLPLRVRRGIERRSISAIILLSESGDVSEEGISVRSYVFERLNTGGQKLNPQEVRNCIYSGPFNDLIIELSRHKEFTDAWGIPKHPGDPKNSDVEVSAERQKNSLYKRMTDCQIVLRFFALREPELVRGSLRSMLDRCMEKYQNCDQTTIDVFRERFLSALRTNTQIFGDHVFRLPVSDGRRGRVSQPLFDALMVGVDTSSVSYEEITGASQRINKDIYAQLRDEDGYEVLVGRGNTAEAIRERIKLVKDVLDNLKK